MIKNFKCYLKNKITAVLIASATSISFAGCEQTKEEKMIIGTSSYALAKDDNNSYQYNVTMYDVDKCKNKEYELTGIHKTFQKKMCSK